MTFEARLYNAALLECDRLLRSGALDEREMYELVATVEAIRVALFER